MVQAKKCLQTDFFFYRKQYTDVHCQNGKQSECASINAKHVDMPWYQKSTDFQC